MAVNESIILLDPLLSNVQSLVGTLEWALGGIFGLYLLFFVLKYFNSKSTKKLLKSIDKHIKDLEGTVNTLNYTVTKIEKLEEKRVNRKKSTSKKAKTSKSKTKKSSRKLTKKVTKKKK